MSIIILGQTVQARADTCLHRASFPNKFELPDLLQPSDRLLGSDIFVLIGNNFLENQSIIAII